MMPKENGERAKGKSRLYNGDAARGEGLTIAACWDKTFRGRELKNDLQKQGP